MQQCGASIRKRNEKSLSWVASIRCGMFPPRMRHQILDNRIVEMLGRELTWL